MNRILWLIFYFSLSPIWADSIAVEDPNLAAFTIQKTSSQSEICLNCPATAATPLNLDATNIIRKIVREERESREKLPYEQAFKAPRTTTPVDERTLIVVEIRDEK
jgi:hypothetical protein